jgi:hypothetical protein
MTTYVEDFKYANCKLFRTPPINLKAVQEQINAALLNAWKSGNSLDAAISTVMQDSKVVQTLSNQISTNLGYQRKVGYEHVESESVRRLREFEEAKQKRLQEVDEQMGKKAAQTKEQIETERQKHQQESNVYSQTQGDFEKRRQEIMKKLKEIGGVGGLEAITRVQTELTGKDTVAANPLGDLSSKVKEMINEEGYDPLKEKRKETGKKRDYLDKSYENTDIRKETRMKRVWEGIKRILFYKIW